MEESLKPLLQELGNAINDSLSDSDRIAEAVAAIKRMGYDVYLVLEATIGFKKRELTQEGEEDGDGSQDETSGEEPIGLEEKKEIEDQRTLFNQGKGQIKFTSQDNSFLRALKISHEDDIQQ